MSNYSKLIGTLVGGAIGIAATFGLPTAWATPDIQGAIVTILCALGTFIAPKNTPST